MPSFSYQLSDLVLLSLCVFSIEIVVVPRALSQAMLSVPLFLSRNAVDQHCSELAVVHPPCDAASVFLSVQVKPDKDGRRCYHPMTEEEVDVP
jgi:hypothetical protein